MKTDNLRVFNKVLLLCTLLGMLVLHSVAEAQILRQMRFEEVPDEETTPYVVLNPEQAILAVYSTIANLKFQSNRSIIKVDDDGGGRYLLHLPPGTHLITVQADGFASIQEKFVLPAKQAKEIRVVPAQEEYGVLLVTSEPSNADVHIDGVLRGVTPLEIRNIEVGTHLIRIEMSGHSSVERKVTVMANAATIVEETLIPDYAKVVIDSDPSGADLYIDGRLVGYTPYEAPMMAAGTHTILLRKRYFHDHMLEMQIAAGLNKDTTITLRPAFGSLSVDSQPSGATVYLDGRQIGHTPLTIDTVSSGKYALRIEMDGHGALARSITIVDGQPTNVREALVRNRGTLVVTSEPPGMAVSVAARGEAAGRTPWSIDIEAGVYTVEVTDERDLYEPVTHTVGVNSGDTSTFNLLMKRNAGMLRLFSNPLQAEIIIDDVSYGTTPIIRPDFPTGTYQITARKPGYGSWAETVTIMKDSVVEIVFDLKQERNHGVLSVTSEPLGVEFTLDGPETMAGTTPFRAEVRPGWYIVNVEDTSFTGRGQSVEVHSGHLVQVDLTDLQQKTGMLEVATKPSEAEVYVNGERIGVSPLVKNIPVGRHLVEARLSRHAPDTQTITISHLFPTKVNMVLRGTGRLVIRPGGSDAVPDSATVYLNGTRVQGLEIDEVPTGRHHVRIEAPGMKPLERWVTVNPGMQSIIRYDAKTVSPSRFPVVVYAGIGFTHTERYGTLGIGVKSHESHFTLLTAWIGFSLRDWLELGVQYRQDYKLDSSVSHRSYIMESLQTAGLDCRWIVLRHDFAGLYLRSGFGFTFDEGSSGAAVRSDRWRYLCLGIGAWVTPSLPVAIYGDLVASYASHDRIDGADYNEYGFEVGLRLGW